VEAVEMADEFRLALAEGAIVAHLQPIVSLTEGRVVGFEALARWRNGVGVDVPPCTFVAVAEEAGLAAELDLHMLGQACDALRTAQARAQRSLTIAVNLSATTLATPGVVARVLAVIDASGTDRASIWIEATETALMNDHARRAATQLRVAGVRLALDDFGVMYASLQYVLTLRAEELKIDRTFVAEVTNDPAAAAIVRCVVGLGAELDMRVVAEGVESEEQERELRRLGVQYVQGYRYGRPDALEQVLDMVGPGVSSAHCNGPHDEPRREDSFRRLGIAGVTADAGLDTIATLAAHVCDTPMAMVSLLVGDRQLFLGRHGIDVRSTPRTSALCDVTIRSEGAFVVPDAALDARFASNPLVAGSPHLRFYAGVPLRDRRGQSLGAVCVADTEPRSLSTSALALLEATAAVVVEYLEHGLHRRDSTTAGRHA
jgi:EAL domain-containing protein (putative c-di-GMP-specific phosphodiesterase class I)